MGEFHTVVQGEYLGRIAHRYGYNDWRIIYNHPENADFRRRRPNPNVIYPDDRIFIPDKKLKVETCDTGQKHRFRRNAVSHELRLILKEPNQKPLANAAYKLDVVDSGGAHTYQGTTDENGMIVKRIPVTATKALLTLHELGFAWNLRIGHLDPVHEPLEDTPIISGVQARLRNLGLYGGELDGADSPELRAAAQEFQEQVMKRDNADGELDRATLDALQSQHGS